MRGDSIRDLYAKTMALFFLGLLAGVGALVDYWPVVRGVPHVAVVRLAAPAVLAVQPAVNVPVTVAVAVPAPSVAALVSLPVLNQAPWIEGEPVGVSEPPVPAVAVAEVEPAAPPVAITASIEPLPPPGPDFDPALVYQLGAASDDSGLLADAMDVVKSTGSTIARGGALTGASIVGAFRAVSGAVKRIKFF